MIHTHTTFAERERLTLKAKWSTVQRKNIATSEVLYPKIARDIYCDIQ